MPRSATSPNPAQRGVITQETTRPRLTAWVIMVSLVLATIAVYWPATSCGFVNYDDDLYVTDNAHVSSGLSWESLKWAWSNPVAANWHPVTVLSHMLDCQVYGLKPAGHHSTNVLLHALNAALVFALLWQMTGARWRSLLVAALFAFHPLRVESVAWIAERKDVLSGCFGLLALIFYARYAQGRGQKAESRKQKVESRKLEGRGLNSIFHLPSPIFYLLSLGFLALGLMSKPILVTWPCVMLLLDYWPLNRMQEVECRMQNLAPAATLHAPRSTLLRLLWEKLPFFALAVVASIMTFAVQQHGGAMKGAEKFPLGVRGGNALISYARYLGKMFWPRDLAVFYPHPGHWALLKLLLAGGLVLGVSALFWIQRRRHPFLLIGWLWFVGTLIPVIGLVQVGKQAMADRYTYLPSLGVLVLAVWGAYELVQGKAEGRKQKAEVRGQRSEVSDTSTLRSATENGHHAPRTTPHVSRTRVQSPIANRQSQILLWVAGCGAIVCCLALTRQQIDYWKDGEVLFRHALQVTGSNYVAHKFLGDALDKKGQIDEAISHYQLALRLNPDDALVYNNLGVAFDKKGQTEDAIRQYREIIRLEPERPFPHYNLGTALLRKGDADEAIRQFQEALRLKPDYADAHNNLGNALGKQGRTDEAIEQYQQAIRLRPEDGIAHNNLAAALDRQGRADEAISHYQEAVRFNRGNAIAHNNLGAALDKKGRTEEAIVQFQEAIRLKPDYTDAKENLARALELRNQSKPRTSSP